MTDSGDVVSVLASISAIIATYHEAAAVIQRLKVQAAEQRAAAPPRILEETVDQAPEEIEREKSRGQLRFGAAFEDGDDVARAALQQVTVQLRGSLLENLKKGTTFIEKGGNESGSAGFSELVDAADLGRDRTIGVLLELRQRLMGATPPSSSPETTPRASQAAQGGQQGPSEEAKRGSLQPSEVGSASREGSGGDTFDTRRSTGNAQRSEDDTSDGKGPPGLERQQSSILGRNRHGSRILGFLQNRRDRSDSRRNDDENDPGQLPSPPSYLPFQFNKSKDNQESNPPQPNRTNTDRPSFTYEEGDNAWTRPRASQDSGAHSARSGSVQLSPEENNSAKNSRTNSIVAIAPPSQQQQQQQQQQTPPNPPQRTPTNMTPTPTITTTSPTNNTSNNNTTITGFFGSSAAAGSTTGIRQPTPENNFLGFCKGAWKLQNGDRKAMQKSKEFNDGWSQSSVYCLTCTAAKCAFAGHIALDAIWTKIWKVEMLGLQLRWPFLAKSHVLQPKVKDKVYSFQCLFCALLGLRSPLLQGADSYLEHISKEHRGRQLNDVMLYKTGCVADHVCAEDEEFDINLFPLTTAEQADLDLKMREEQLAEEANAAAARSSGDKQDSMFSEPWNEGLSDFHYDEELEATEKEN